MIENHVSWPEPACSKARQEAKDYQIKNSPYTSPNFIEGKIVFDLLQNRTTKFSSSFKIQF
jgi:hypothetical protein